MAVGEVAIERAVRTAEVDAARTERVPQEQPQAEVESAGKATNPDDSGQELNVRA